MINNNINDQSIKKKKQPVSAAYALMLKKIEKQKPNP